MTNSVVRPLPSPLQKQLKQGCGLRHANDAIDARAATGNVYIDS